MTSLADVESRVDGCPRLAVASVSKRFPGVLALQEVSLEIMPGEILAVIGENGAGKSTLMKILAGILVPDSGSLSMDGQRVHFRWPGEAIRAGVSLIHQELNLHENLSVAENIFLGREPARWGWVDRASLRAQAETHLRQVGLDVSPDQSLASLSTASRQLVEVAKALSTAASVVIMDEPTSSLTASETDCLFALIHRLKQEGVSIVYISHRLKEVTELADRVEVLRDGRGVGQLTGQQINHDAMVSAMVGRDVSRLFDRTPYPPAADALVVEGLVIDASQNFAADQVLAPERAAAAESDCPVDRPARDGCGVGTDLRVRCGEIVGIAGLVGSGRSELLETIFGIRVARAGRVRVDGAVLRGGSVREAISCGLVLVPEDRKRTGLLLESSVCENATIAAMPASSAAPWLDRKWQRRATAELIDRLAVKTASQSTSVTNLSGGNQQKIAWGKWLLCQPKVLMLDEPTRGVDIGAKQEIYMLLDQLAKEGMAILFVSSEMEEVLSLADRVLVMHEGKIAGELSRDQLSEEALMRLAVGVSDQCN